MAEKKPDPKVKLLCQNCFKNPIERYRKDLGLPYCVDCINEYRMSISKRCSLPKPLKKGYRYILACEVEVREMTDKQRDDGKVDIHFKTWLTGMATIQNEKGEKMSVKDTRSASSRLRFVIEEDSVVEDFMESIGYKNQSREERYQWMHRYLRHFYPQLRDKAIELYKAEENIK